MFDPYRQEHLLSSLLRMFLIQLGSKGADRDALEEIVANPDAMRIVKMPPLSEEAQHEKACENDRAFFGALIALAGQSKTTSISRDEFREKYGY